MDEFIGIRYGRIDPETDKVDWHFKPHSSFDGIGGFANIFTEFGADLGSLPKITHPARQSILPLLKLMPRFVKLRKVLSWAKSLNVTPDMSKADVPGKCVSWHVFTRDETNKIRRLSRRSGVTVNSILMKHLDKSVRQSLEDPSVTVPWMIPVNMRGKIFREDDPFGNYSSYITASIASYDRVQDIHKNIHAKLIKGEHWAHWKSYELTHTLPESVKKTLISKNLATSQWNIGSFSNLGVWDSDELIKDKYLSAPWLFAPPTLRCQQIGAGCITYQNQLSLTIQAHPELSNSSALADVWMKDWVEQIKLDLP